MIMVTGASGMEHVILRPHMFATSAVILWSAQIRAGDVVRGPYPRAAQAPIDPQDLAEVAARALLTDDLLGREPQLTGPESLTLEEMVIAIGEPLGRPLRYEEVPPQDAFEVMTAFGYPEELVAPFLGFMAGSVGRKAFTSDEVERILGRPARTFPTWAADHTESFR
ncbi:hypothetical protein [Actinomadura sp. 3N407]|uniref:hypothetical protein n=1 Tax=Actinomadura sp. 3N407 TaxID=3457423 RepID=UPI003FCC5F54